MWTCPRCGKELGDEFDSCWYCVNQEFEEAPAPEAPAPEDPGNQPVEPARAGLWRRIGAPLRLGLDLAVLVISLWFLVYFKRTPAPSRPTTAPSNATIVPNQPARARSRQNPAPGMRGAGALDWARFGSKGPQAIPDLVALMRQSDPGRPDAAYLLGKMGAPAVPALIPLLQEAEEPVRHAAANALGQIGGPGTVSNLVEVLAGQNVEANKSAALALGLIGANARQAIPALLALLRDDYADVRACAAWALTKIGPRAQDVPALIEAFRHDFDVTLQETVDRRWAPPQGGAFEFSRWTTVQILPQMRSEARSFDFWRSAPYHVARALADLGLGAEPGLVAALEDKELRVRLWAAIAWLMMGSPAVDWSHPGQKLPGPDSLPLRADRERKVLPVLLAALRDEDANNSENAFTALRRVSWDLVPGGVESLVAATRDADPKARIKPVRALARVTGKSTAKALDALHPLLGDADPHVRAHAAESLWQLAPGNERVLPVLLEAKQHREARACADRVLIAVGRSAVSALAAKGDPAAQNQLGDFYANAIGGPRDEAEALKWYGKAAEQGNVSAQYNLGVKYEFGRGASKDPLQAVHWYRLGADQGHVDSLNNLAWLLATHENQAIRDGPSALRFAEKAVLATQRTNANYLDTLAAAYAETGQFAQAISAQKEAIAVQRIAAMRPEFEARLSLYESNQPYRRPR